MDCQRKRDWSFSMEKELVSCQGKKDQSVVKAKRTSCQGEKDQSVVKAKGYHLLMEKMDVFCQEQRDQSFVNGKKISYLAKGNETSDLCTR